MRSMVAVTVATVALLGCTSVQVGPDRGADREKPGPRVYYLEIVTEEVDAVCAAYEAANGQRFGEPDPRLGDARTAPMPGGGLVGVRAPLRSNEEPVVRPYWLVDDIEAAVAAAEEAGARIAHPPLEIPGHGTFAIYFLGGVQHGLWEL